jgi:hypothetical protein
MNLHRLLLASVALFAMACAGHSEEPAVDVAWTCADGVLVVEGPIVSVEARYPEASPPERLLGHSASPAMFITVEAGGWLSFVPYEDVPAGDVATIETFDVSSGSPVCPLEVVVSRP